MFPSFVADETGQGWVPFEVAAARRPFTLATPDFKAPALILADYPSRFKTLLDMKALLKIEENVFAQSLHHSEADLFGQLSGLLETDEDNKSFVIFEWNTA